MKQGIPPWEKILISIDEAAALAGVGRRVVDEWRKDSNFPSFRCGEGNVGKCRIDRKAYEKYLAEKARLRVGEY